jgi:hypothetical protein
MVSCISGVCVVALLFSQSLFTVMPRGERISVTVNSILPHVDMWVGSERCTLNHVVPSQPQLADTDIYIIPASLHARPFILPRPVTTRHHGIPSILRATYGECLITSAEQQSTTTFKGRLSAASKRPHAFNIHASWSETGARH